MKAYSRVRVRKNAGLKNFPLSLCSEIIFNLEL